MNDKYYRKKDLRDKKESLGTLIFRAAVIILIPVYIVMLVHEINKNPTPAPPSSESEALLSGETQESTASNESGGETAAEGTAVSGGTAPADLANLTESYVYTFLQGPKAWESKTEWSGSWCEEVLGGQKFSVFGCGLCDLANIYCTLTPYECSPVDMFEFARQTTDYSPTSGYGAIAWEYMQQTLEATGIYSSLMKKEDTYEEFQQNIAGGITAIALVNSGNDSTYWTDVTGHYVNIWLYNSEDDTVFLADSGNPDHNRRRIPLRYVYDALKTADTWQYLLVQNLDPAANEWQHNGIDRDWMRP